jgi:transglutaminase-like putative cysteine protease
VTEGSLAGAVAACRRSGAAGWDLVDLASRLVHDRFTTYSVLHVWERPETAFRRRRGYCAQYNGALAQVLCRLGLDAWLVYAARARFDDNAEWALGHAWVRVRHDGGVCEVCARSAGNRPGPVGFTCLGRVRRLGPVARVASGAGTAAAAFAAVLAARLRGHGRPRWVEHGRAGR